MGSIIIKYSTYIKRENIANHSKVLAPLGFEIFKNEVITLLEKRYGPRSNNYSPQDIFGITSNDKKEEHHMFGSHHTIDYSEENIDVNNQNNTEISLDIILQQQKIAPITTTNIINFLVGLSDREGDLKTKQYGTIKIGNLQTFPDSRDFYKLVDELILITHKPEFAPAGIGIDVKSPLNMYELCSEVRMAYKKPTEQSYAKTV